MCVLDTYRPFSMLFNTQLIRCVPLLFSSHAGGEITCNEISCYRRTDCKPRFVPGICCPEYDNCPPLGKRTQTVEDCESKVGSLRERRPLSSLLRQRTAIHYCRNDHVSDDSKLGVISSKPSDKPSQNRFDVPLTTASTTTQSKHEIDPPKPGIKIKEITKPEEIRITDDKPKVFRPTTQGPGSGEVTTSGPPEPESTTARAGVESTTVPGPKEEVSTEGLVASGEVTTRDYSRSGEASDDQSTASSDRHSADSTTEVGSTTGAPPPSDVTTAAAPEANSTTAGPEVTSEPSINVVVEHSGRNQSFTVVGAAGLQRGDDPDSGSTTVEPPATNYTDSSADNKTSDAYSSEEIFDDLSAGNSSDSAERNGTSGSMEIVLSGEGSAEFDDGNSTLGGNSQEEKVYETEFHSTAAPGEDDLEVERDVNPERPHIPDDLSIHSAHMTEDVQHEKRPPSEKIVSSTVNIFDEDLHLGSSSTQDPREEDLSIQERSPGEPPLVPEWERNQTQSAEDESGSNEELENYIVPRNQINGEYSTESSSIETGSESEWSLLSTADAVTEEEASERAGSRGDFKKNAMELLGIEEAPTFSQHVSDIYAWFRSS